MDAQSLVELINLHLNSLRQGSSEGFEIDAKKAGIKLDADTIARFQRVIQNEHLQVRSEVNRILCEAHLAGIHYAGEKVEAYTKLKAEYRAAGYDRLI